MEFYYGVDMGGTTIKMGRFDREGTLLEKWEIPTRKEDSGKHIFDDIAEAILTRTAAARGQCGQHKGSRHRYSRHDLGGWISGAERKCRIEGCLPDGRALPQTQSCPGGLRE